MKKIMYKTLVVLMIISLLLTFLASNKPAFGVQRKPDDFYYHGTTGATYSQQESIGLAGVVRIVIQYFLGILTYGPRAVIVGWIAIFEWVLVITFDNICGTEYRNLNEIDPYGEINEVPNRITIEKIVFNEIPLFDANIFDFEKTTLEDYADKK